MHFPRTQCNLHEYHSFQWLHPVTKVRLRTLPPLPCSHSNTQPSSWRSDLNRMDRTGRWYSVYQWMYGFISHSIKIIPWSPSITIVTIYYANITSSSAVFILRNPLAQLSLQWKSQGELHSETYHYIPKIAVVFKQSNCQRNTICWSILNSCWSLWHLVRKCLPQGHSASQITLSALQHCCQN